MDLVQPQSIDSDEKSLVILQSLICLLREKNLLTRADVEELNEKVQARARECAADPFHCCPEKTAAAAREMAGLDAYVGMRYGGKHRRLS